MDNVAQVRKLFTAVESKIHEEITILQEALSKIDRHSDDPSDQWAYPIYERIIERRKKMLAYLST